MLRYARHRVDDTPTYLVTEYSDYTTLGHPETIERPEGTTTLVWTGHRLDEITVGGRTTSLNFDAGGRLASIEYPSGVIEAHGYDAHGRLATIDWLVERKSGEYCCSQPTGFIKTAVNACSAVRRNGAESHVRAPLATVIYGRCCGLQLQSGRKYQ